ncbi:di-heme oxidoreductase family protein [Fulvivirga ligni]|uniref:di-heme oxidoreductase family protein n=1 Tax=Fulvivirga ligni TaxID=2904246 RepID=UPI001F343D97|nr:di-heme oxidoredictase family protein [Fulvivirga ligni]UII19830.1 c-type cytochrome [Fulvivirga ligni]
MSFQRYLLGLFLVSVMVSCGDSNNEVSILEEGEEFSGGDATVADVSVNAFGHAAPNLQGDRDTQFVVGNSFFNRNWVTAPSSTEDLDGVGPLFNARSCSSCHFKDGRGRPKLNADDKDESMLYRLSISGTTSFGGPMPEPNYGTQLNPHAILGVVAEGDMEITYQEVAGTYADGSSYSLRKPYYQLKNGGYGAFAAGTMISPRTAPHMVGLGLLASIDESTILAMADPDDVNNDGISGRVNMVWDFEAEKQTTGRFGWKANVPTLKQQTAGAFLGDIGITSSMFTEQDCMDSQTDCKEAVSGGSPELKEKILEQVTLYSGTLAVPKRRDWEDPVVLQGKQLFISANCSACHTMKIQTGYNADFPEFADQTIRPYTDMLLHDMGEELADGRPDFQASGSEWKTPPLWGIGLIEVVNGHTLYLHDGRARNLDEAILWHGGEGEKSKQAFIKMEKQERDALVKYLKSL